MIIILNKKYLGDRCINRGFYFFKITNKLHVGRLFGDKESHPIGYHIPVLIYLKD